MKLPADEHALESASNDAFRHAGCWAHHMDTSVPGFPDSQALHPIYGERFIEYKYIREKDLHRKMTALFQPDQLPQLIEMVMHGARVYLVAFHVWAVYAQELMVESLLALRDTTAIEWLDAVDSWEYDNLRGMVKAILTGEGIGDGR